MGPKNRTNRGIPVVAMGEENLLKEDAYFTGKYDIVAALVTEKTSCKGFANKIFLDSLCYIRFESLNHSIDTKLKEIEID